MDKKWYKTVDALSSVLQAGISVVIPVLMFLGLGKFLQYKFNLGGKTMLICIIFGVISGFYSMIKYLFLITKNKDGDDKNVK